MTGVNLRVEICGRELAPYQPKGTGFEVAMSPDFRLILAIRCETGFVHYGVYNNSDRQRRKIRRIIRQYGVAIDKNIMWERLPTKERIE